MINEPGPPLDGAAWRRVLDAVAAELVGRVASMADQRQLPPGVAADAHAS